MSSLISIVVPIYNVEQYLQKCVDSLINQTYKNLEIILVDDGSPDNCPKICDEYAKQDSRIKVIHKENGGLSDARNAGMKIATGEYILFIDSDDWIKSEMIEDMYNRMIEDNSDLVSSGVLWVDEDGVEIRNATVSENCVLNTEQAMSELINDGKLKQHVWNKLYKADLIKNIPFDKGKYHEDVFWSYKVIGEAERISIEKNSYYFYVQRSESIMGEKYSAKRLDALDAMELRCEYMKERFPKLYNNALTVYIGSCMYHLQLALSAKVDKLIIRNVKSRLIYRKNGNVFENLAGKQKWWMHMFVLMPTATCKLRNLLKIGL